ncbi:MAG: tellurite resistance/C4-dicarboxylate transporter family protein [Gammaproteobacteria bacterium]|nr:tellurite resistance/C4-dicarboxylate transporter family protein [Gammaproteobacteria bacterium]
MRTVRECVVIRDLSPAYFALVMATGIVSIAAKNVGLLVISNGLFVVNIVAYPTLVVLTMLRALCHPRRLFRDMVDHQRGPGFLTTVAATCILGIESLLVKGSVDLAMGLLAVGVALWLGLTYTIFTAFTVKREKPPLERGITGAWLIAVVATQSIAVLSALIARQWSQPYRLEFNFFALSMWSWGGMFYIWIISLIFYRYSFFAFSPTDLSPPYWINMGAMAISTMAGARLIENAPDAPFLASLAPFLKGFTVLYWATATWWIPMLVLLGVWRHLVRRFPLRYDPLYWGAVFPLGMYSAASWQMTKSLDLPFLATTARLMFIPALAAWSLAFVGLLRQLLITRRGG